MEHFFFLFQRANEQIKKEKKDDVLNVRPQKNRIFGGCVDCAPCVSRQMDDEYFEKKGITKDKKKGLIDKSENGASDIMNSKSDMIGNMGKA